jgi:hypothetical protein
MRNGVWLGAMVAVACTGGTRPGDGGQFGEEAGARCVVVQSTPLQLDEESPLGFTPQAVLAMAEGSHEHELSWLVRDETTGVAVTVTSLGTAAYVEQAVETDEGYGGAEPYCAPYVAVDIELEINTDDGALAESFTTALSAEAAESAGLIHDLEDPQGSFDPWDHAPEGSDYDEMRAWLSLTFTAEGLSGKIHGQGSGTEGDPNDPDSISYAENLELATFGIPEEP